MVLKTCPKLLTASPTIEDEISPDDEMGQEKEEEKDIVTSNLGDIGR